MREAISHALHSSLEWDDSEHAGAVDKLTAFSFGSRLGTLLWRVKYDNDAASYKPVVLLLARQLKNEHRGISRDISQRVCEQALNEWLFQFCTVCLGAKETMQGELLVTCSHCSGSGTRRYTDEERQKTIGAHMPKQVKLVLDIIGDYDRRISAQTRKLLE